MSGRTSVGVSAHGTLTFPEGAEASAHCQVPTDRGRRLPCGRWIALAALLGTAGCTAYHPSPLTPGRVEAALRPKSLGEVRVEAARLRHPILRPVAFRAEDDGLSPEQAAVFAVLCNPALRAVRDARGLGSV